LFVESQGTRKHTGWLNVVFLGVKLVALSHHPIKARHVTTTYEGMEVQVFTHEDRHDLGRADGKVTRTFDAHGQ
jgi:hypothetical protein